MMKIFTFRGNKILAVLAVLLIAVLAFAAGTQGIHAVQASSAKRELPVYNVKTDEKNSDFV